MTALERRALEMWRAREMLLPAFARRMTPDAWDMQSGAWQRILDAAEAASPASIGLGTCERTLNHPDSSTPARERKDGE